MPELYRSVMSGGRSAHTNIARILSSTVTRGTWDARRRATQQLAQAGNIAADPARTIDSFLGRRLASVKHSTVAKDLTHLKWLAPRIMEPTMASQATCLLEDLQRGLRHLSAGTPKRKALPFTKQQLRLFLPTLPRRIRILALLAFRTAARIGDMKNLRECDVQTREGQLLVSFPVTKTNQDGQRRADHKTLITDPEPMLMTFFNARPKTLRPIWSATDIVTLRRLLRRFKPPPEEVEAWQARAPEEIILHEYTFHSFKRGAAAEVWQALADRKITLEDLLLLLKHRTIESALEYCPVPMLAAKAVGTRATGVTTLEL